MEVSQRAQDLQEKITEEEERDQEATSWWRRMSSGKKFRGSKEGKGGIIEATVRKSGMDIYKNTIVLMIICYDRVC